MRKRRREDAAAVPLSPGLIAGVGPCQGLLGKLSEIVAGVRDDSSRSKPRQPSSFQNPKAHIFEVRPRISSCQRTSGERSTFCERNYSNDTRP